MHSRRLPTFIALAITAVLIATTAAPAALGQTPSNGAPPAGDPPSLFTDAPQADAVAGAAAPGANERTVIRKRTVGISMAALDASQGEIKGGPALARDRVRLNLFDDVALVAVRDRLEPRPSGGFIWYGHVEGAAFGYVTLVVGDGVVVGDVTAPGGVYEIRYGGNGTHVVRQIDPARFPNETHPNRPRPREPDLRPDVAARDSAATIDVLVVYSAAARTAAGGNTAMNSLVDLAVADANSAYANSGVVHRFRLVYKGEVSYTESGSSGTDLNRLTNTSDGFLDQVHSLRNQYDADLVSLIVENLTDACGVAWYPGITVLASDANVGFSVVQKDCASSNHSFAHETGHNLGGQHDWDTQPDDPATEYNHAYIAPNRAWRTILAYPDPCNSCPRLQYFSNPDITYQGAAMGVPQGSFHPADNRRALNNNALVVANFRQATGNPQPTSVPIPTLTPIPGGPANNNFANAQTLTVPSTVNGNSVGATNEAGENIPSCGGAGASVWFRYTPSTGGVFTASTAGSSFDTTLALYTGASLASLVEVPGGCNDDFGSVGPSQISVAVTGGTTYHLRLAGFNAASGTYTLNVSGPPSAGAAATPTATVPVPTATPTTTGGVPGGRGFAISASSGGTNMTWLPGTGQTGYALGLFLPTGLTIGPSTGVLPAAATSYFDARLFTGTTCYLLLPLGAGGALGRSDLLCWLANTRTATGSPQNFTMRLNQSNTATFTWSGPLGGGQDSYQLLVFGGTSIDLPGSAASASHTMAGPTCYAVIAKRGATVLGFTDVLCGFPGVATL